MLIYRGWARLLSCLLYPVNPGEVSRMVYCARSNQLSVWVARDSSGSKYVLIQKTFNMSPTAFQAQGFRGVSP